MAEQLKEMCAAQGLGSLMSPEFADYMDSQDELRHMQEKYLYPEAPEGSGRKQAIYLCGNSLGIQPKGLRGLVTDQLDKWAAQGVEGHFTEPTQWLTIDDIVQESCAKVVGALPHEVAAMNSLTVNLHLMMCAFYEPTASRHKILIEKKAFPSDVHAVTSQILHRGFDPKTSLVEIECREGEDNLRDEDIEAAIMREGDSLALVMFSGVQYYTGQFFDCGRICAAGHAVGAKVGLDLAHAVGNVPLKLHDWGADFACWCSYKYLNCGPGSLGGCFVHERHGPAGGEGSPVGRLSGWWGHQLSDRFVMDPKFVAERGAYGFRLSNPPVLLVACVRASMNLYDEAGMDRLRTKSKCLTAYLEELLVSQVGEEHLSIFTPKDPERRGAQLSLSFKLDLDAVFEAMQKRGFICDVRKPNVMRVAPTPMYNTFRDVYEFVSQLKEVLKA